MTRWALLVLPVLAGCSVSMVDEDAAAPSRNECTENAECGEGICQDGTCRATEGTFSSVLFEVTPPASASKIAGIQYIKRIDGLSLLGGPQNIALAQLAHLEGSLVLNSLQDAASDGCDAGAASFDIWLTPSDWLLGLGDSNYRAKTVLGDSSSHTFSLSLPAAEYDIYVEPSSQPAGDQACPLAPQLFRRQAIPAGNVTLSLNVPTPSFLTVKVRRPITPPGFEGWRVDMIDPETRRVLSNQAELTVPVEDAYVATLAYSTVVGAIDPEGGRELIRLRPPDGQAAPTILLERSGLEARMPGEGIVDQITQLPQLVEVEGQVLLSGSLEHVASASITVSATRIDAPGIEPVPMEYSQKTTSDEKGYFSVRLVPGVYRVVAVPAGGSAYATGVQEWTIRDTGSRQAGRAVEVTPLAILHGSVTTSSGVPVTRLPVSMVASIGTPLESPLSAGVSLAPRSATAVLDANGAFEIGAEPGKYDFSVRPPDGTDFAWFVKPNVFIAPESIELGLGTLQMPLPLAYSGAVTAVVDGQEKTVPGALIRAYVYVDSAHAYISQPTGAASVLQIGETRAGDTGHFELLLPAKLDLD